MNSKVYKWCAVPKCKNSSLVTPDKVFVHVPRKKIIKDKWLKLAGRNPNEVVTNSLLYFCEDHFAAISSKPNQKRVILQSKTELTKIDFPSESIIKSIPEDSTATFKQETTEAVDIKTEPESHIVQYTHSCATSEDLTEELHIKEEPEFETEPQLDFEIEPEESKPDIHEDYDDLIASNLYPNASTTYNNADSPNNIETVNTSVGRSNIESKTDQFEVNIKIKTEPDFDESTDTCESDYGNEEDIILAALVKANAPTLAYLKGKDIESPSRSKTSKAKPSKKRRKIAAKKGFTKKKHGSRRLTPAEKSRRYRDRLKRENPGKYAELCRKNLENKKSKYRKVSELSNAEKELQRKKWRQQKEKRRMTEEKEITSKKKKPLTVAERVRRYRESLKNNPEKLEQLRRKKLERMKTKFKYRKVTELSNVEKEFERQKWRERNEERRQNKEDEKLTEEEEITSKKKRPLTAAEKVQRYRERLKNNPEKLEEARRKNLERMKSRIQYRKVSELSNAEKELRRRKWREEKVKSRMKRERENVCRKGKALTAAEKMRRYRDRLKQNNPEKFAEASRKNLENIKSKYRKVSELSNAEKELRRQKWRQQKDKSRINQKNET